MSILKNRSLSDIQHLHPPFPHLYDPNIKLHSAPEASRYTMMVLRFASGCTEDDVDQKFLRLAMDLGITVPQSPKTTLDLVTSNVSALELTPEELDHHLPLTSRTSESTNPTSDSSSEIKQPTATSSLTNASIASTPSSIVSSSIVSTSSQKSAYEKFKRGVRRISVLRRRRAIDAPPLSIPLPTSAFCALGKLAQKQTLALESVPHIPGTFSHHSAPSITQPLSPPAEPCLPTSRLLSLTLPGENTPSALAACQRSLQNPHLIALRASQLEEQGRFTRYEAAQRHLMGLSQISSKRTLLSQHTSQIQALQSRHADALASLEHRHLCAEVDLHGKLEGEKRACDTRLRHMQAYCDPSATVMGMPRRTVSRRDHRHLDQQRHARNCMDNLHAARINVLREKQTKQLETVAAAQEAEMDMLRESHRAEIENLDADFTDEETALQREFQERRARLVRRWELAEAIERRRLHNLGEGELGPLPLVEWGGIEGDSEDGGGRAGGENQKDANGFVHDAMMAYDVKALGMS